MLLTLKQMLFGSNRTSKSVAKSRLHFVLVQDRTGLTSDQMVQFRKELIQVIERYFVIDKQAFDIAYQRESDTTTLLINSPVIVKRQEGVKHEVGARRREKNKPPVKESMQAAGEVT